MTKIQPLGFFLIIFTHTTQYILCTIEHTHIKDFTLSIIGGSSLAKKSLFKCLHSTKEYTHITDHTIYF